MSSDDVIERKFMQHSTVAQVFQAQTSTEPLASYVWDLANPGAPEATLAPASQITALNWNLKDHSLLGAGLYNGQFGVFDLRKGPAPADMSPIEHSHR